MENFRTGDTVTRKSYGNDILFRIVAVDNSPDGKKKYILRGVLYRIIADAYEDDLQWQQPEVVRHEIEKSLLSVNSGHLIPEYEPDYDERERKFDSLGKLLQEQYQNFRAFGGLSGLGEFISYLLKHRGAPGKILQLDSSEDFLKMCFNFYKKSNLIYYGKVIPENEQPNHVVPLLKKTGADILVITGHDAIKKNSFSYDNIKNYRNSAYFIQSVKNARKYEKDLDKLCIFAGACQSYYEGIMEAGANFASSPGRILIHALDPAKVADHVALTDVKNFVTPEIIAKDTKSGLKGICGVKTRGHFRY